MTLRRTVVPAAAFFAAFLFMLMGSLISEAPAQVPGPKTYYFTWYDSRTTSGMNGGGNWVFF